MFLPSTAVCLPGRQGSARSAPPRREPAAGGMVVFKSRLEHRRGNVRPAQLAFGRDSLLSETEAGPPFCPSVFSSDRAEEARGGKKVRHTAFVCDTRYPWYDTEFDDSTSVGLLVVKLPLLVLLPSSRC